MLNKFKYLQVLISYNLLYFVINNIKIIKYEYKLINIYVNKISLTK